MVDINTFKELIDKNKWVPDFKRIKSQLRSSIMWNTIISLVLFLITCLIEGNSFKTCTILIIIFWMLVIIEPVYLFTNIFILKRFNVLYKLKIDIWEECNREFRYIIGLNLTKLNYILGNDQFKIDYSGMATHTDELLNLADLRIELTNYINSIINDAYEEHIRTKNTIKFVNSPDARDIM